MPAVVRLEELWLSVRECRVDALVELDRLPEAVGAAEELRHVDRLREGPHGLLMRGLARQGRTADALRVFETFRTHLRASAVADGCSSTPVMACAPCSRRQRPRWLRRSTRNEVFSCRCGWASRRVRRSGVVMTTSGRR